MPMSTLTRKGQTTIPKRVRDHLHLQAGDKLEFQIDSAGQVLLRPATADISELDGFLADKVQRRVSLEEMDEAIRQRGGTLT